MFTGLVEELGTLRSLERGSRSARLVLAGKTVLEGVKLGDSIAVNGVCLTVTDFSATTFSVDVMHETLERTNLGELRVGSRVNLERALRLGDRLGGHLVSGHVDGVGVIRSQKRVDIAILTEIEAPEGVLRYCIPKGSIAVDGISLTIIDVLPHGLTLSLIPHTAGMTTLGFKQAGDRVNLEGDLIGKYVERLLGGSRQGEKKPGLTLESLMENGFA